MLSATLLNSNLNCFAITPQGAKHAAKRPIVLITLDITCSSLNITGEHLLQVNIYYSRTFIA